MDWESLRNEMVETQLVRRGITDEAVLAAMREVPRHLFVAPGMESRAYGDHALPIGEGQTISQPFMVALMTQALELTGSERVLEIGTGSGYQTTILSKLAEQVLALYRGYPKAGEYGITHDLAKLLLGPGASRLVNSARRQQGLVHLDKTFCRRRECARCPVARRLTSGLLAS